MRRTLPTAAAVLTTAALLAACSGSEPAGTADAGSPAGSGSSSVSTSEPSTGSGTVAPARLTGTVARGLEVPWGLTFLPDGDALVSERDSHRIRLVSKDGEITDVGTVAGVDGSGEGGLLGIAVSPDYAQDRTVFAYFSAGDQNVIASMTYDGTGLSDQRTIFDGIPAGSNHNGGRIAFGPDGFLYVGTGESGRPNLSQDRGSLGGKILRITPDGEPAPGNPFDGSPVYSLGHRNVQGLAWDQRGQLWAAEFGQNEWDELNRIEAGADYGWPVVEGKAGDDRFVDPVRQWHPEQASPSGIAIVGDSVFMAGLRGQRLWQIPIPDGKAGKPRALLTERFGRLRTVTTAPDGSLWVATSNRDGRGRPADDDDRILRLTVSG